MRVNNSSSSFVTPNMTSVNPIFQGPDVPGVLPPFVIETAPATLIETTSFTAPLRPTESATAAPSATTTFVRSTPITTLVVDSSSTTLTTSTIPLTVPTNIPSPSTNNTQATMSFINNPLTVALVAIGIIALLAAGCFAVWAIRRHRREAKKKARATQNIPLRPLTPPPAAFNPYFIDLELGSGFGWGRLSGVSFYLTEEAQERRGGGQAQRDEEIVARPAPVAVRTGRLTRFLEMF